MSKNNGMDSQDLDVPNHKYNARRIIFFFSTPNLSTLIRRNKSQARLCWNRQPVGSSAKTPCVCNSLCRVTTEIINHRNKENIFLKSQKSQLQLCLLWSIFSPGIFKGFLVTYRLYPSTQWFSSRQCFDLIFYSQVICLICFRHFSTCDSE